MWCHAPTESGQQWSAWVLMYSAKNAEGSNLNDMFNRQCKKATITGKYEFKQHHKSIKTAYNKK